VPRPFRGPGVRPGHGPLDAGAVTVEAALSLLAMVGVVAALVWGMSLVGAQLTVGEASRAAARAAARGEPYAVVAGTARRLVPGAAVDVRELGRSVPRRRVVYPRESPRRWVMRPVASRALLARSGSKRAT